MSLTKTRERAFLVSKSESGGKESRKGRGTYSGSPGAMLESGQ